MFQLNRDKEKDLFDDKTIEQSQEEIFKTIDSWGEYLEVRLTGDDFQAVKDEVWMAVKKERLTFDHSSEQFRYVLKNPIKDKNGNTVISQIIIHETTMEEKRGISKKKDNVDTLSSLFSSYCKDDSMKEIPLGFISRIMDRDQAIISAVILGFFVQAVPSKKSEE